LPKHRPVTDAPEWAAKLSRRERRFVEEYIIDLNGSAAIRRCGWPSDNADATAAQILRRGNVAKAVSALVAERSGATQSRVIEELGRIAFADVHDISFVKDGQVIVRDTAELTPDQRAVVAGYETNERGFVTVKLHDKIRALDSLAKCLGMKRSVNAAPGAIVNVQVNNNTASEAGERVIARIDELVQRRQQAALPPPTEQPLEIELQPIRDIENV
jgi:phage terminase small subunit